MAHPGTRPALDTTRPHPARVYDYWLGGKDNFAADREAGEAMLDPVTGYPGLRLMARANRRFVLAAVTRAASQGISQFIDLGCGLPATPSVHQAARAIIGDAAVVYVDNDPLVIAHVSAIETRGPGLAAVHADVTEPGKVLEAIAGLQLRSAGSSEEPPGLIDFARPACLILGGTLSDMDAEVARETVRGFAEVLAPGSCVIISCASYRDEALAARLAAVFDGPYAWRNHSADDVASFFAAGGLRVVHGRPMDTACWPACSVTAPIPDAAVIGGVGVVDDRPPEREGR